MVTKSLGQRRQHHATYMREWRKTHLEKRTVEGARRRIRVYTERRRQRKLLDPEYARRERQRGRLNRTPESHRVQEVTRRAIRAGMLARPMLCDRCNEGGFIEAAHSDYKKPLDVLWLCRSCHRRYDRQPKGGYIAVTATVCTGKATP